MRVRCSEVKRAMVRLGVFVEVVYRGGGVGSYVTMWRVVIFLWFFGWFQWNRSHPILSMQIKSKGSV